MIKIQGYLEYHYVLKRIAEDPESAYGVDQTPQGVDAEEYALLLHGAKPFQIEKLFGIESVNTKDGAERDQHYIEAVKIMTSDLDHTFKTKLDAAVRKRRSRQTKGALDQETTITVNSDLAQEFKRAKEAEAMTNGEFLKALLDLWSKK